MRMVVLDRQTILEQIAQHQLVTGMIDPAVQISPNGVELTLQKVYRFDEAGTIDFSNTKRHIPRYKEVELIDGSYLLTPGPYLATYNETVRIPKDMIALARPRSSLLRSGVTINTAVWDAGYEGRGRSLLVVFNPHGFKVMQNARLLHLVFIRLLQKTQPYRGVYQGET